MLPGLGQRGLDLVGEPRGLGQAFEEVSQYAGRGGVVGNGKVEGERLGNGGKRQSSAGIADGVLERLGVPSELGDAFPIQKLGVGTGLQTERSVDPGAIPVGEGRPVVGLAPYQLASGGLLQ